MLSYRWEAGLKLGLRRSFLELIFTKWPPI